MAATVVKPLSFERYKEIRSQIVDMQFTRSIKVVNRIFLFPVVVFMAVSCLKDDGGSTMNSRDMPVRQFVALLKSDQYNPNKLPPIYEISDIPELLKHGRDEQVITHYPLWEYSFLSTPRYTNEVSVGLTILWIVESTRLDADYPSESPAIAYRESLRKVPLKEVASLYEDWWQKNKNKTAAELRELSPFEGTNITWY